MEDYKIKEYTPKVKGDEYDSYQKRYAIYDNNDQLIDDAQGYGYKSLEGAHKFMWYKKNRNNFKQREREARDLISKNKEVFSKHKWILSDCHFIKEGENVEKIFWKTVAEDLPEIYNGLNKKLKNDIVRILS